MRNRVLFIAVLMVVLRASSVGAQTFNGTLGVRNPAMPVVAISTPSCTSQGTTPVHYTAIPFVAPTAGAYNLRITSSSNFASFYVYSMSFNPASGTTNCVAGANSGSPKQLGIPLTANQLYFLVPFDDTFAQTGGTFSLVVTGPAPVLGPSSWVAVGPGAGGGPHIRIMDLATGISVRDFFAYHPAFAGGVRLAVGDVSGDGFPDVITAPGPGGGPHILVFDGVTGAPIRSFLAYPAEFAGGVYVAAADVNGDGRAEIITSPGPGAGPHVKVFDGVTSAEIGGLFAYSPLFTGGVYVGTR